MKKLLSAMSLMAFLAFFSINVSAQTINNADDLKNFYVKYLSDESPESIEALVSKYSTSSFNKEWKRIVIEIGLYDPLTKGYFDDNELIKNTLVIKDKQNKSQYEVSFNAREYPDNIKTESIIVFVENGKISGVMRPEDKYCFPEGINDKSSK